MKPIFIILLHYIAQQDACLNQITEHVLYKIGNSGKFYSQANLKQVLGRENSGNDSMFLWYLEKHPNLKNHYRLYNLAHTDYVMEAQPNKADWNAGSSNCTNDNQWIQFFDILDDKNATKCLMSLNNMRLNGKCYFLQANRAPYLYEINCTLLANEFEQKPPSIDNIFEFIGMSDPNVALRGNCTNEQVNEVDNISKNICRSKILQAW